MSKRDLEELKNQLEQIKIRKQRDKRIVFSLPVEKYNKFLTAILLNNPLEREVDENLQKKLEELIDDFINEVDFYDLTEEDIENMGKIYDELI
jgi:predicted nucleic acid-binding protein